MGQALPVLKVIGTILGIAGEAKSLMTPPPKAPKLSSLLDKPAEDKLRSTSKNKFRGGLQSTIKNGFQGLNDLAPTSPSILGGGDMPLKDKIGV